MSYDFIFVIINLFKSMPRNKLVQIPINTPRFS